MVVQSEIEAHATDVPAPGDWREDLKTKIHTGAKRVRVHAHRCGAFHTLTL